MIEINLIPDVKQEYLKARKARTLVISGTILVGIVSIAVVVLLSVYLFGIQTLRSVVADNAITKNEKSLKDVPDLANMLTIQSQLANINDLHDKENITSRLFDLLTAINPGEPNHVSYSLIKFNTDNGTIHIDAQAPNGFVAADVFKKTLEATKLTYESNGKTETMPVVKDVTLSNLSYGEDSSGAKVLRFSVDVTYEPMLFSNTAGTVSVSRPNKQDATDSSKYVPDSLFSSRAADIGGSH